MLKVDLDEIKRKIRKLKRAERAIRGQDNRTPHARFVWGRWFDLGDSAEGKAKYTLPVLAAMSPKQYKAAIDEYFAQVYFELYRENGIVDAGSYDPGVLARLGLSYDAGEEDIKRRFRELAKIHHPDVGGDAARFIELMRGYEELMGR